MRRSSLSLILALATTAAATGMTRTAHAQNPQEQQLAQALFEEGRRLMDQKKYAEACPKLAESQRLDPGGGTLLNLAICHEKEGKLATAQIDYSESLALATRDGRKDRQQIAREHLAAIDRLVPRVTIVLGKAASEVEGLELKLDGLVLRRASWGIATPVDPGTHVVEANASGRTPWSGSVTVEASQRKSIEVPVILPLSQLPIVPAAQVGVPATGGFATGGGAAASPIPAPVYYEQATSPDTMSPDGRANPVFYTVLGLTLVVGATAAITGYQAISQDGTAKEGCLPDRRYCRNQSSIDAADSAATYAWVSTVSLGVVAAGVIALIIIPSRVSSAASATRSVGASAVPGGASFQLRGTF